MLCQSCGTVSDVQLIQHNIWIALGKIENGEQKNMITIIALVQSPYDARHRVILAINYYSLLHSTVYTLDENESLPIFDPLSASIGIVAHNKTQAIQKK